MAHNTVYVVVDDYYDSSFIGLYGTRREADEAAGVYRVVIEYTVDSDGTVTELEAR